VAHGFEHRVVEVERKDRHRWLVRPADGTGRTVEYASPADYLDLLGGDGWELVSVTPMHARSSFGGVQTNIVMYTLRRPLGG
jgi:hypothetical protein